MNGERDPALETALPELSKLAGRGAAAGAGCPDELLLAGYAEERLLEAESDVLEVHLAACSRCRELVAALARESSVSGAAAAPAPAVLRGGRRRATLVAPLLAAAAVVVLAAWWWQRGRPEGVADALVAAADRLVAAEPDHFASFRPLSPDELRVDPRPVERGPRLRGLSPCGTIDEERPRIEWEAVRLAERCEVSIVDGGGTRLLAWSGAASGLDWPADSPVLERGASYVVAVRVRGPLGELAASATFRVAAADGRDVAAAAVAAIGSAVAAPLADLVAAHWLLCSQRWLPAAAAARRYLAARPADADGRLALFQALARLDASEADALAPAAAGGR